MQTNIKNFLHFFFLHSVRISGESLNFDDEKINKNDFYKNKKPFIIDDIDVNKILISKKEPYGKKVHFNTLLDMMIMITLDHYV